MTDILKDVESVAAAGLDVRTKLILVLGAVVLASGAAAYGAHYFEQRGAMIERAGWLAKQVKEQAADAALVRKHEADMQALRDHQQTIERQTSEKHETELAQLRRERDADRLAADRAGGLRIPAAACAADRAVAGTEAASAGGRDEAGAGTIRLPVQIENDLWAIANDADEVSAQLRACQGWIRSNGFYGAADGESGALLDRIIPAQNSQEATP
jgi:hypothetical protein